jgi:putative ABC transport system permease protein
MRLAQLAPVWALGITRARLARFEWARSLILAGLTFALALPVGLALAWMLLAVINVQAFGWRLPMQVFPIDAARLLGLALIAATLAAALPALRLARISPSRLLKVFAHEA